MQLIKKVIAKHPGFSKNILYMGALFSMGVGLLFFVINEQYAHCLISQPSLCIESKKYTSLENNFSFRYPKNYPLSAKSSEELSKQYGLKDYLEWVNFSEKFYPNAGGERLGNIIISSNSNYSNIIEYKKKTLENFNNKEQRFKGQPPIFKQLQIGGEDAWHISHSKQPAVLEEPSEDYILIHNGKLFRISFTYNNLHHKEPIEYYNNAIQLIVSTFEFH